MTTATKDQLRATERAELLKIADMLGGELSENDLFYCVRVNGAPGISWATITYSPFFGGDYSLSFTDGDCRPSVGPSYCCKTAEQVCSAVARWRANYGY